MQRASTGSAALDQLGQQKPFSRVRSPERRRTASFARSARKRSRRAAVHRHGRPPAAANRANAATMRKRRWLRQSAPPAKAPTETNPDHGSAASSARSPATSRRPRSRADAEQAADLGQPSVAEACFSVGEKGCRTGRKRRQSHRRQREDRVERLHGPGRRLFRRPQRFGLENDIVHIDSVVLTLHVMIVPQVSLR